MPQEPLENPRPTQFMLRDLLVATAVIALFLGLLVPAVRYSRELSKRDQCADNMRQVGLAMRNYQDAFLDFPPAYTVDQEGSRLNSWRLLAAAFMECKSTCQKWQMDEPWDSPRNRELNLVAWEAYRCPSDQSAAYYEAPHMMIVGPGMFAEGSTPTQMDDIKDGASDTIMVVETVGLKIPWAAPRDLEADKVTFEINSPKTPGISSNHSGGANCLFVDGAVRFLSDSTSPQQVQAMCTRAGGEVVELPPPERQTSTTHQSER